MLLVHTGLATLSLLCSMVAIYIWNYTHWTRRKIRQGFQIPLFGDHFMHFFGISTFQDVLQKIYVKFPDARYCGFYQYLQPGIMIRDPSLIKAVSTCSQDCFLDRTPFLAETDDDLWKRNLFSLRGEKWREMRSILTPAFTSSKMKQMFKGILIYARQFNLTISKQEEKIIEVEFKDLSSRFANDIIASVAFGLAVDSLKEPKNDFFVRGMKTTDSNDYWKLMKMKMTLLWPSTGRLLNTNMFDKGISDFFRDVIKLTIEERRKSKQIRSDMIQLLMKADEGNPSGEGEERRLEDDDIASQALIFFLGGFETVSSCMCFMAYELAANQEIQNELIKEIDDHRKAKIEYEDICQLEYLDMVLAECLRKWPPILNLDRICTKSYTIEPVDSSERQLKINESDLIWLPVWCIHHDPKYWPEPDRFDPQRFSNSNKPPANDPTYIPFGLGGRGCIGHRFAIMEIKIFFYALLQRYRIVTVPKSTVPIVPAKHTFNLASKYGFWFGLEKRLSDEESAKLDKECKEEFNRANRNSKDEDQNEDSKNDDNERENDESKEDNSERQNGDSEKDNCEHKNDENEKDIDDNATYILNSDVHHENEEEDQNVESKKDKTEDENVEKEKDKYGDQNADSKKDENEGKSVESKIAKDEDQTVVSKTDQDIHSKKDNNVGKNVESKMASEENQNVDSKMDNNEGKNAGSKKDSNEVKNVEIKKDNDEKVASKKSTKKGNKKRGG